MVKIYKDVSSIGKALSLGVHMLNINLLSITNTVNDIVLTKTKRKLDEWEWWGWHKSSYLLLLPLKKLKLCLSFTNLWPGPNLLQKYW